MMQLANNNFYQHNPQSPTQRGMACRILALALLFAVQLIPCVSTVMAAEMATIAVEPIDHADMSTDFVVPDTFTSNLPLLVLEPGSDKNRANSARLNLYSGSFKQNSLGQVASASLDIHLSKQSNQPGKANYAMALQAHDNRQVSLANLPEGSQWRLHGSSDDRGMLRNGLAYSLGRAIFAENAPQTTYCEVLFKINDQYHYQGIYILAQSLEQITSSNPTDFLLAYEPANDKGRAGQSEGEDSFLSLTLSDRGFSMVYPPDGQAALQVEGQLDVLQNTLHSLTPDIFLNYLSVMDQDSAIDLFILNEMLLNPQAGPIAFYLAGGKNQALRFIPRWDFDQALDNSSLRNHPLALDHPPPDISAPSILSRKVPVWRQLENGETISDLRIYPLYENMGGQKFLWFDRLFLSRPFLMGLFERYHDLRRGPLAPEKVSAMVDDLARQLGPALLRDWQRWRAAYEAAPLAAFTDAQGEKLNRQTYSYEQELVKIRYLLRSQDLLFMEQIAQLHGLSADLFDQANSGNLQAGLALATIIAFLLLTHFLTRKL